MSEPAIDLFGDPVPENWGRAGRPEHIPTRENRDRVQMMVALGWSVMRIAGVMRVTQPTLRKHYFQELRARAVARDQMEITIISRLWREGVGAGNVGAIRELRKAIERNDLMTPMHSSKTAKAKAPKPGKKEQAVAEANKPDLSTPMGELLAQRQGQSVQ